MMQETLVLDELDQKLADAFPGQVVRKDLVRQTKVGFNVPVYVLEYLLGKYCSSTDPEVIDQGLEYVRDTLSRNYVRADESEKIKSLTREAGTPMDQKAATSPSADCVRKIAANDSLSRSTSAMRPALVRYSSRANPSKPGSSVIACHWRSLPTAR